VRSRAGAVFVNGKLAERPDDQAPEDITLSQTAAGTEIPEA
jgi:hypothetical protein